jgi:hypothetical protein
VNAELTTAPRERGRGDRGLAPASADVRLAAFIRELRAGDALRLTDRRLRGRRTADRHMQRFSNYPTLLVD